MTTTDHKANACTQDTSTRPSSLVGDTPTLGALIKEGRLKAGLSQRGLAHEVGLDHTYISKIESDTTDYTPKVEVLEFLARDLELDLDEVLQAAGILPESTELKIKALYQVQGQQFLDAIAAIYEAQFGSAVNKKA